MEEASIGGDQSLIAHHQTTEMTKPGEGPFHDPPASVAAQFTPVLMGRMFVVAPGGDDRLNAPVGQPSAQRVAVIAPIRNQALRPYTGAPRLPRAADRDRVEGLLEERDLRRGRRVQVCSQRSTRAIDQYHPLGPLAAFRLPDFGPPFLAGIKLPSAKHSSHRSFCWSLSWARKARQSLSKRPISSHSLSRRQQVLGLPYRRGSSLHWAPVHRIHRIPSKHRRSSTRGRPPCTDGFRWGRCSRIASHCSLVSLRHAMSRPPFFLGDSWRYDTLTGRF